MTTLLVYQRPFHQTPQFLPRPPPPLPCVALCTYAVDGCGQLSAAMSTSTEVHIIHGPILPPSPPNPLKPSRGYRPSTCLLDQQQKR